MSDVVIAAEHLSKLYRIGAAEQRHETLTGALKSMMGAPWRNFRKLRGLDAARAAGDDHQEPSADLLWALRDVSFEVRRGEVLGLIGRNGAGKSTLLKILSRITDPTRGRVRMRGGVSSLLEVGTGFHPELTGRENIYLNGTILGMSKAEIDRKFDEIVDFSGVEAFLETPIKRYSSGMKVRLAFAVAAHLEPEILIVDEVLAVGDYEFQQRCIGRMRSISTAEGRTILFVSHSMQAVSTLTTRGMVLEEGRVAFLGETEDAIQHYLHRGQEETTYRAEPSPREPRVTRVELTTTDPNNVQRNGEPLAVAVELHTPHPIHSARLAVQVVDSYGREVAIFSTFDADRPMCREPGTYLLTCHVPKLRLYMGRYTLKVNFRQAPALPPLDVLEGICPFEVVMYGQDRVVPWRPNICVYTEEVEWALDRGV